MATAECEIRCAGETEKESPHAEGRCRHGGVRLTPVGGHILRFETVAVGVTSFLWLWHIWRGMRGCVEFEGP